MTLKNIGKSERLNNVSINIYRGTEDSLDQLTDDKKEKHINLLYVQDLQNVKTTWVISRGSKIYPGS